MATYKADWGNGYVIEYRDLTWQEYQDVCANVDPENITADVALAVYNTCCLKGPDIRLITAGIGMYVAKQQIVNNPFAGDAKSLTSVLNAARQYVSGNFLIAAQAAIAATFDYKPEEIKSWSAEKFFVRFAQAELVSGNKLNPTSPVDSTEPKTPTKRLSPKELAEKRVLEKYKQNQG